MFKRFAIAIVLLAAIGGGLVWFNLFRQQAIEQFFANRPVTPVSVSTVVAKEQAWVPTLEAIGSVGASHGVDLAVETSGVVREIGFASNEKVKKGALLLQLEDTVQQADLEAAKAQAELERQKLERAKQLEKSGVGSSVTLETAAASEEAAAAQVEKLEAVLEQKQLRAPFSGTIGIPQVNVGQYLSPGSIVATLQDLGHLRVDFTLPEQQLPDLATGQAVVVGVTEEAFPYAGTLTGIDPKIDTSSRLVALRAEIIAPEGDLTPGQFVRIRLVLPEEQGVIVLPQTAVVTSLYGDYVYVVRPISPAGPVEDAKPGFEVRQVFVKPGRRSEGNVEILDGVEPGDRIVTVGQNRLINGAPVTPDGEVPNGTPGAEAMIR
jgi:membrane fusion protein, multidrug efflux system